MIVANRARGVERAKEIQTLSDYDQHHLREFERLRDLIRDRARSVGEQYQNGVYICGRPGTGKTRLVKEILDTSGKPWIYRNARMSPLGLWALLNEHPEHTVVLDDIASLFHQRQALQILLAALGGEPGCPRPVTYTVKTASERTGFDYSGGVVAISNVPLRRDPLADAVASRVTILEHSPTDEHLAAFMRYQAIHPYKDLTRDDRVQVVEFVISESRANDYRLDLRWMERGWQDYRFVKHGKALRSWQDLVKSSMRKPFPGDATTVTSKKSEILFQRERVKRAVLKFPSDVAKQIADSGLKRSTFFHRKKEIERDS